MQHKTTCLAMCTAFILLALAGCSPSAAPAPSPQTASPQPTLAPSPSLGAASYPFSDKFVEGTYFPSDTPNAVIQNRRELLAFVEGEKAAHEAFLAVNTEGITRPEYLQEFCDAALAYDEAYFQEKCLLIAKFESSSGYSYKTQAVTRKGHDIVVELDYHEGDCQDVARWIYVFIQCERFLSAQDKVDFRLNQVDFAIMEFIDKWHRGKTPAR